jgi:hypothetical protein
MARTRKAAAKKAPAKKSTAGVTKKKAAASHKHASTGRGRGRPKGKGKGTTKTSSHNLTDATNTTAPDFVVRGTNDKALFTLVNNPFHFVASSSQC